MKHSEGYVPSGVETVVKVIPLTEFTELRLTHIKKEDGSVDADVRPWYCTRREPEKRPSNKGIRVSSDVLPELISGLQDILARG